VVAADTSSLVAYFAGERSRDTDLVQTALAGASLCISPIVLTEILSDPKTRNTLEPVLADWPLLEITPGFWLRASRTRARLLERKLAPKLPDTFIAQSSIDYSVALITRDGHFGHFAKHCGLKLA
jgi:hypothetical protein